MKMLLSKKQMGITAAVLLLLLPGFTHVSPQEASPGNRKTEKILGADISFLPQLEAEGVRFKADGKENDALLILRQHGFNYVRLRLFVNPEADSGYSKQGYCGLGQTLQMAKRIKAAKMKWLLDFHYSDTWADPGKQFKPEAWKSLPLPALADTVEAYTKRVMLALQHQQTLPDMVQVGNEINNGMLWPDGNFSNPDHLALLIKSGIAGVKAISASMPIMLHIALGGQNGESRTWLDAMMARGVTFDIIGQSYYPQWHGTLEELSYNLTDLSLRYPQEVVVVEYTRHKREVNDIAFNLPRGNLKGTFIWEPLNTWEYIFEKDGTAIDSLLKIYPEIAEKYGVK